MIPLIDLTLDKKTLDEIKKEINQVIDSKNYILGVKLESFEDKFAKYIRVKYAVGVGNGTDALRLSLRALGIGRGDKVLTVSLTSPFTIIAIIEEGAIPVFCDIDEKTWTIDLGGVEKKIDNKAIKQKSSIIPDKREFPVNNEINPCVNFYDYACSKVIDSFELREDRSHHSFSFNDAAERLLEFKKKYFENCLDFNTIHSKIYN